MNTNKSRARVKFFVSKRDRRSLKEASEILKDLKYHGVNDTIDEFLARLDDRGRVTIEKSIGQTQLPLLKEEVAK